MAFDNTKYDVELNGVGYRINGYLKSELDTFVPRLGSGDQRESEFDLLRSRTIKGFEGGILQRYFEDDSSVFASEGLYPIYDDSVLYPVDAINSASGASSILGSTKAAVTAWCKNNQYIYIAYQTYNTPTTTIKRINTSGTVTSLTLPANLQSLAVTSMVIWNTQLWITTGVGSRMYYMDLSSTSVTEVTGGAAALQLLVVWNDQLYGTNANTNHVNYALFRYSGDTATRTFASVGTAGQKVNANNARLFVYNNRIILTRPDGLYAYDGIRFMTIEDTSQNADDYNFFLASVLKGYLYYFMPDGMYRYNGSLIEKLYDISEIGRPIDACVGKNRLWLLYTNSAFSSSSRYDKSMGYDYSSGNNVDGRVAVFNGKGLYTYGRTTTFIKNPGTEDFSGQGENHKIFWFANKLYVTTNYEKTLGNLYYYWNTNELTLTGQKPWRIVTSIDDGNFPMIDKVMDNIEAVLDGNVASDEDITVEYRTSGFDGSTGWTSLGTIKTQTRLKEHVFRNIPAGLTYKRVHLRFTGTTTAGYGIAKLVMRYMLSPDYKYQWQFTALCFGDHPLEPLVLKDGSNSSQTVRALRGNIYSARASDQPIKFIDMDKLDLNGAHNNSTTTITVNDTSLLKGENGFIQIDDEVMYWTAKTSTQLTVQRAQLGTIAASHSDNAKVFIVYRAIVRKIVNERIAVTDRKTPHTTENKSLPSEITLILQEV